MKAAQVKAWAVEHRDMEKTLPVAHGLVLRTRPGRQPTWLVRYRTPAGLAKISLGTYPEKSLASARTDAAEIAAQVKRWREAGAPHGEDPATLRRAQAEEKAAPGALADVVAAWLKTAASERRDKTMEAYKGAADRLLTWAHAQRLTRAADLGRTQLDTFRTWLVKLPRHVSAKGAGGRGRKVATSGKRSPASINRELRSVKTMLGELRRGGHLPGLDSDAIADTLRMVKADKVKPSRLKTRQIAKLLEACDRHDAATFTITRDGRTDAARHEPVKPLVVFLLLTGMRLGEALTLAWEQVDLETTDPDGKPIGEIELRAGDVKTASDRTVYLNVCPTVRKMLAAMRLASGGDGLVWDGYTEEILAGARKRLAADYGAPVFLWSTQHSKGDERSPPTLRATCATYLHSAPAIYGAGALHLASAQLGHSPEVARRHYANAETGIPRDARTLEQAMRIEALVSEWRGRGGKRGAK